MFRYTTRVLVRRFTPQSWGIHGQRFDMTVLMPGTLSVNNPRPLVVLLHPAQVLANNPLADFWRTCSYLATHNFLCVMTREETGEFGSQSNRGNALDLGRRGLAMLRTTYWLSGLYDTEAFDPADDGDLIFEGPELEIGPDIESFPSPPPPSPSPPPPAEVVRAPQTVLTGKVQQRAAAYGYSLGGSAVQDLAALSTRSDNVRCIMPVHSGRTTKTYARRVRCPILGATGEKDSLTPDNGPFSLWDLYKEYNMPFAFVTINGAEHVDSVCGNQCPAIVVPCCVGNSHMPKHMRWINGFAHLYLNNDRRFGPVFWDIANNDISRLRRDVKSVRKRYEKHHKCCSLNLKRCLFYSQLIPSLCQIMTGPESYYRDFHNGLWSYLMSLVRNHKESIGSLTVYCHST